MHRLFSTFSNGPPALGLLLLRLIVGAALIVSCGRIYEGASPHAITPHLIAAGAGLLLVAGLWTPVAGTIVAIIELLIAYSHTQDPWVSVLLASLGVALALLGPGTWSVDARLFGWKRIEIRRRDN
jgi:uncharacterized membrane protein YphA (DoxX/SURF4 family)